MRTRKLALRLPEQKNKQINPDAFREELEGIAHLLEFAIQEVRRLLYDNRELIGGKIERLARKCLCTKCIHGIPHEVRQCAECGGRT